MRQTKTFYWKIALTIPLLIAFGNCSDNGKLTDKAKKQMQYTLEGTDVREHTFPFYTWKDSSMQDTVIPFDIQTSYNHQKDIIELGVYNADGSSRGGLSTKFDYQDMKKRSIENIKYNADGSIEEKNIIRLDKNEQITEDVTYNSAGSVTQRITLRYDENQKPIEKIKILADSSLSRRWTYRYDTRGRCIETKEYTLNNRLLFRFTHKHNDKGTRTETKGYDAEGTLQVTHIATKEYGEAASGFWGTRTETEGF